MAPTASTSRLADSDSNSGDDEEKARARKKDKRAKKAARLQKEQDERGAAEAIARKQAAEQSKKDQLPRKRRPVIHDLEEEDQGSDVELVVGKEKRSKDKNVEVEPARKPKKVKVATNEVNVKKDKSTKERGRPSAASNDDSSSEEESPALVSLRTASLSREPSAARSRADSKERSASGKPASKRVPSASTSAAKPTSSTSKQGPKPFDPLALSANNTMSKPKSSSHPSLQVDTTNSRALSSSHASAQSPPLSPNKGHASASSSTTSRPFSGTSYTHSTSASASTSSPLSPPLRIWTPTSSHDIQFPLSLSLDCTITVPSRKLIQDATETLPAKIENLAEASAFLEFALARGKLGIWKSLEVKRNRLEGSKGGWEVIIALGNLGSKSKTVVEVTAAARVGFVKEKDKERERDADQAELGGKMEIVRALVKPSQAVTFLGAIDPQLVEPLPPVLGGDDDLGFADDDDEDTEMAMLFSKEEADRRKDEQGRLFFQTFKTVHPRHRLFSIERKLKSIGDLEFAEVCAELVEVMQKGTVDLGEGVKLGFGRWVGDVATNLKASLGHIHRFCNMPHHAYLDLSIQTIKTLLDLCIAVNGGPEAEEWINGWLQRLEKDNEAVEADYKRKGVPKPTPKLPPSALMKRVSTSAAPAPAPAPAPTRMDEPSPPPPPPGPAPLQGLDFFASPRATIEPKRSRQDEPSIDPRAAAKRQRLEESMSGLSEVDVQPVVEKEMAMALEVEFVQSPQAMVRPSPTAAPNPPSSSSIAETSPRLARSPLEIKSESYSSYMASTRRTTMSPAPARAALQTRASPIVARASPTRAVTRASPSVPSNQSRISLTRASPITRATPFISSTAAGPSSARPWSPAAAPSSHPPSASASRPSISLTINTDRTKGHQAPTPEPTPEAEARGRREPVLYEREAVLLENQPILDGKSLVAFGFEVHDEAILARLHESLYHDNAMTVGQLPLRARAVFRRTSEDDSTWPSISINLNDGLIPLANSSLAAGCPITALQSFEITRLVQRGANTLTLARWKTSYLPSDLRLSIELYRAVSEEWFRAQLAEDERTYDLYDERAKVAAPVGVSIIDPITELRIVTPVRGANCLHLETFDLDAYLQLGRQRELGDWTCPLPSCRAYAPPTSLGICAWQAGVLTTVEADINVLDIVKSYEAEEVKPVVVKGEQ